MKKLNEPFSVYMTSQCLHFRPVKVKMFSQLHTFSLRSTILLFTSLICLESEWSCVNVIYFFPLNYVFTYDST